MDSLHIKAANVIAEVRSWIGTPWKHQQRVKGWGADCGGYILGVLWALDYPPARGYDYKNYSNIPDAATLRSICDTLLDRVAEYAPGDIGLLRLGGKVQHVGIEGDGFDGASLIHSYVTARKVREERIDENWWESIVQA